MKTQSNALSILDSPIVSDAWNAAGTGTDAFPVGKYVCLAIADLVQPSDFELKIGIELIVEQVLEGDDYALGMARREYLPITDATGSPSKAIFKAKSLFKKLDPEMVALPLSLQVNNFIKEVDGSKKVVVEVVKTVDKNNPQKIYTNYNIVAFTKEDDGSTVVF